MRITYPVRRLLAPLIVLILLAIAILPLALDQPFGAQTDRTLSAAFHMRRWSPLVSVVGALGLLAIVAVNWRRRRWLGRTAGVLALVVAAATVWLTRQNPFEWMFNPLPGARYSSVARASFVQPTDVVLAVRVGDDAAAYPIRQLAYHHLVNDRIGGSPAVVTY